MKKFNQINFIKKIYFNRMAGTEGEKRAAEIIGEEIAAFGGSSKYEEFDFPYYTVEKAALTVYDTKSSEIEVTAVGRTGSTPKEGIEAPLFYGGNGSDTELCGCEGKIVLVNSIRHDIYKRLLDKKAAGFLTFGGTIFDEKSKTDLDWKTVRENTQALGALPGLNMRPKDALKLAQKDGITLKMTVLQENVTLKSGNVIAEIAGERSDEILAFTAHYDSTRFSKGAWDNASGTANLMALYAFFASNKPARTMRFIWCGGEELGLLGSKAYVKEHKDELDKIVLGFNVDMSGTILGGDIACVTGDDSIKSFLQYSAAETAFPVNVSSGIFPSDSSPFANAGVPFITFQRGGQGGMHSRNDIIDALCEKSLQKTTEFIRFCAEKVSKTKNFPFPRQIPQNLVTDLENYFNPKN